MASPCTDVGKVIEAEMLERVSYPSPGVRWSFYLPLLSVCPRLSLPGERHRRCSCSRSSPS